MLSFREYPMGDGQTWVGLSVAPSRADVQLLEDYLGDAELAVEFVKDGVRVEEISTQHGHESTDRYLRDALSGLPFRKTHDGLVLDRNRLFSPQHNLIDACYFRDRLRGTALGQRSVVFTTSITGGAIDRYEGFNSGSATSYLSSPIVDYEARTRSEFDKIIHDVGEKLRSGPYFRRLWLRGQRTEYLISRSPAVCNALGFGASGTAMPSLIPSLGRYALTPGNDVDDRWVMAGPNHWWKKPYLVWVIRSNPQWLSRYPEFSKRIEDSLRSDDDFNFGQILADIQFDERVPTDVDDLRQWFFAFFKYSSWIFVLQQYGYYSSMLDITTDCEVALYFAQSQMEHGQMVKIEPVDGRVVYLFAESKNQSNFFAASEVDWGDDDWANSIPPRLKRQFAGGIFGSSATSQNLYGHYIVARIFLKGSGCHSQLSTADLFPSEDDDLLFRTLRESQPALERLY